MSGVRPSACRNPLIRFASGHSLTPTPTPRDTAEHMPDLPPDLATSVNDQAKARVEMSIQGYAKYLTPEAIDTLRASFPGMPPARQPLRDRLRQRVRRRLHRRRPVLRARYTLHRPEQVAQDRRRLDGRPRRAPLGRRRQASRSLLPPRRHHPPSPGLPAPPLTGRRRIQKSNVRTTILETTLTPRDVSHIPDSRRQRTSDTC